MALAVIFALAPCCTGVFARPAGCRSYRSKCLQGMLDKRHQLHFCSWWRSASGRCVRCRCSSPLAGVVQACALRCAGPCRTCRQIPPRSCRWPRRRAAGLPRAPAGRPVRPGLRPAPRWRLRRGVHALGGLSRVRPLAWMARTMRATSLGCRSSALRPLAAAVHLQQRLVDVFGRHGFHRLALGRGAACLRPRFAGSGSSRCGCPAPASVLRARTGQVCGLQSPGRCRA